ncbi:hypothetical protein evm_002000 [Chilo suppressalis]|nr:hypothetical protein evm_002000 [Chilo suppressalis]
MVERSDGWFSVMLVNGSDNRWVRKVLEWRPHTGRRPPTRWTDDIVKCAGSRWMRIAQDRALWRSMGEAYVQQWTRRKADGWMDGWMFGRTSSSLAGTLRSPLPSVPLQPSSPCRPELNGTLSIASAAPTNRDSSAQASEYEYDYESAPQQQAQEPQESASHYDAYISDVQAAASGDPPKKGFSRGSGLRTIAVGSANQAKTALGNQAAAGYQAAYMAKNTLAQSAAQASATAQAALAGKQVILSGLEQQVRDAKVGLQGEEMQLQQAKRAAQAAAQAAQQAMHQVAHNDRRGVIGRNWQSPPEHSSADNGLGVSEA